jgi:hypothetical protein
MAPDTGGRAHTEGQRARHGTGTQCNSQCRVTGWARATLGIQLKIRSGVAETGAQQDFSGRWFLRPGEQVGGDGVLGPSKAMG